MLKGFVVWCSVLIYLSSPVSSNLLQSWNTFYLKLTLNQSVISPECLKAYQNSLKQLNENDLDALKMFDATAKLPSGILSGNINQYGNFDECLEVKTAQYCLVDVDLSSLKSRIYSKNKHLIHSHYFFRDKIGDPTHRMPGFSTLRWGFCIPQKCTSTDLIKSLSTNLQVPVNIRPKMCQKFKEAVNLSFGDYMARIFFAGILLLVVLGSFADYFPQTVMSKLLDQTGYFEHIMKSFSLRKNISKLVEVKENSEEIACLHGMRAIGAFALLLCHKAMSLFFNPYINRTQAVEKVTQPWAIMAKNAIVYTDVFILISGLLNAQALFKTLEKQGTMKFKDKLINRLFRLLPNIVALILFCTYLLPQIGSGPLWPNIIEHHSDLCKKYMWRNFLFIHNFFGFNNMCLTHTHQVGIDMQLFLITPPLVYLVWKNNKIGIWTLIVLGLLSTVLRFWILYTHQLITIIHHGISISKMFDASSFSYILPTHRLTIYVYGILLAYLLQYLKPKIYLTNTIWVLLWCVSFTSFLLIWLGPYHMVQLDFQYNVLEGALISALYPLIWGASLAFLIYATTENAAGWLGRLLSWRYFQIFSKIGYAVYLVQFPIFFYNVGLRRHTAEYHLGLLLEPSETFLIFAISTILVLCIEMPFQNIKQSLLNRQKMPKQLLRKSKTG